MGKIKRKASPTLLAWSKCRMQAGVKPGKKASRTAKKKILSCVVAKIGKKK